MTVPVDNALTENISLNIGTVQIVMSMAAENAVARMSNGLLRYGTLKSVPFSFLHSKT